MKRTITQWIAGSVSLAVAQSSLAAGGGPVLEGYGSETAEFTVGARLFDDRTYRLVDVPQALQGMRFLFTTIEGTGVRCAEPGTVYALTPAPQHDPLYSQDEALRQAGFELLELPDFQLFSNDPPHRVRIYRRDLRAGDRLLLNKVVVLVAPGLGFRELAIGTDHPEAAFAKMTEEEIRAYKAETMRRVADLSLLPPTINTSPLPKYDYDQLDYGMTIGIARTPKGRLWASWIGGEDGPKSFMVAATSDDDGETWSKPRLVIDSRTPGAPVPCSVIIGNFWTDPSGKLWLFFDQTMNHYDERQGLWATTCENPDDDEPLWSKPYRIWHGAVLNKPTVLNNGEWLLPVEFPNFPGIGVMRNAHPELRSLRGANVFVSADQGKTWTRRACVRFPRPSWPEHMFVELKDGRVWMLARTGGGVMESFSSDQGRTWTEPSLPKDIRHPSARFHVRRLASGRILLIKHGDAIDTHEGRSKLTAWLSADEGQTWQGGLMLDERTGISYPDGFQAPNGTIYVSYDRNRSTDGEILMARFTEEDVLAKQVVGENSKLKMLISRPLKGK
jgi:hypothetical protein